MFIISFSNKNKFSKKFRNLGQAAFIWNSSTSCLTSLPHIKSKTLQKFSSCLKNIHSNNWIYFLDFQNKSVMSAFQTCLWSTIQIWIVLRGSWWFVAVRENANLPSQGKRLMIEDGGVGPAGRNQIHILESHRDSLKSINHIRAHLQTIWSNIGRLFWVIFWNFVN